MLICCNGRSKDVTRLPGSIMAILPIGASAAVGLIFYFLFLLKRKEKRKTNKPPKQMKNKTGRGGGKGDWTQGPAGCDPMTACSHFVVKLVVVQGVSRTLNVRSRRP